MASKAAMQIRYLDTMQAVSKNAGTKVIFMPSADQVERIAMSNMQTNLLQVRVSL